MTVLVESGPWGSPGNGATSNSTTITTSAPSFIMVNAACDTGGSSSVSVTSVTATGLTFSKLAGGSGSGSSNSSCVEFWGAYSTSALSSVVVTANYSAGANNAFGVISLAGVEPSSCIGVTISPTNGSNNLSATFSGCTVDSMVFVSAFQSPYTNLFVTNTAGSDTTIWENQNGVSQYLRSTSSVTTTGINISSTGWTSGCTFLYAGIEILALAVGGGGIVSSIITPFSSNIAFDFGF